MYYRQTKENLKIFVHEPCQFVVTARKCSRNVELLVFTEVEESKGQGQSRMVNLYYYLCSEYNGNPHKRVIKFEYFIVCSQN